MAKFTVTLREIGTYKEVLRSQVLLFSFTCKFYIFALQLFSIVLLSNQRYSQEIIVERGA